MTNSFFDKLKKGMSTKEHISNVPKKDIKELVTNKLKAEQKSPEINSSQTTRASANREGEDLSSSRKTKLLIKSEPQNNDNDKKSKDEKWIKEARQNPAPFLKGAGLGGQEGQLTVDIYQTETDLIIQSAIAGISHKDLDITIERDLIIIKGIREEPLDYPKEKKDYFTQECYWGPFSRKIVLPVEINPDQAQASMKQGVLIIQLPKTLREKKRKIEIRKNS